MRTAWSHEARGVRFRKAREPERVASWLPTPALRPEAEVPGRTGQRASLPDLAHVAGNASARLASSLRSGCAPKHNAHRPDGWRHPNAAQRDGRHRAHVQVEAAFLGCVYRMILHGGPRMVSRRRDFTNMPHGTSNVLVGQPISCQPRMSLWASATMRS
jgi:hypothetical protein